jgi:hypothetical protein
MNRFENSYNKWDKLTHEDFQDLNVMKKNLTKFLLKSMD